MLASLQSHHHRFGPVFHCVPCGLLQQLPTRFLESSATQSNVVFTKQSQWVFLKYKYEHLPLLLKSFSGFPFSSNRDQLFTSTLKALLPFHSSVPHHSSLAFCVLGILSSFSSSCMIGSSLPPGLLFLLPGTSLASSLSCIQGDLLWRSGPNSHCTQ